MKWKGDTNEPARVTARRGTRQNSVGFMRETHLCGRCSVCMAVEVLDALTLIGERERTELPAAAIPCKARKQKGERIHLKRRVVSSGGGHVVDIPQPTIFATCFDARRRNAELLATVSRSSVLRGQSSK